MARRKCQHPWNQIGVDPLGNVRCEACGETMPGGSPALHRTWNALHGRMDQLELAVSILLALLMATGGGE